MGLAETTLFYLLAGAAIGAAELLRRDGVGPVERAFRTGAALLFWPVFLPPLLARPAAAPAPTTLPDDEMATAIERVGRELATAFSDIDGWAGEALAGATARLPELRRALDAQAHRVRDIDRVLREAAENGSPPAAGRAAKSETSRRENVARLRETRERTREDLMGTLAWIRELVSMIHLARFTGAPPSRAEELVRQIADAVEQLSTR